VAACCTLPIIVPDYRDVLFDALDRRQLLTLADSRGRRWTRTWGDTSSLFGRWTSRRGCRCAAAALVLDRGRAHRAARGLLRAHRARGQLEIAAQELHREFVEAVLSGHYARLQVQTEGVSFEGVEIMTGDSATMKICTPRLGEPVRG